MKIPLFTLIHNVPGQDEPLLAPDKGSLGKLNPNLRNTIFRSIIEGGGDLHAVEQVASELTRQDRVITVGLWDLGALVGGLPKIVQDLNESTPVVTIFEVQSAIPSGLFWAAERIEAWAEERLKRKLTDKEHADMAPSILDENFWALAEPVRKDLGVDYLIGLTPAPIAGDIHDQDGYTVHCDFFSSASDADSLVSTDELRTLASEAGRAYEYAVGITMLASLLAQMNPDIDSHPESGCLFDYHYNRHDIGNVLRNPKIEESCYEKMLPEFRGCARDMLAALDRYPRPQVTAKSS